MAKDVVISSFRGINNLVSSSRLTDGFVLDAVNVDLTSDERFKPRAGKDVLASVTGGHSLTSVEDRMFVVIENSVRRIDAVTPFTTTTLRSGLTGGRMAYTGFGGYTWWSNGVESGLHSEATVDRPWSLPKPAAPILSETVGSLPAGTYRVAILHTDANGEESPASVPVEIDLAANRDLVVTLPAAPAGAVNTLVFCAKPGGVLQLTATVAAATASTTLSSISEGRSLGDAYIYDVLPAGNLLAIHNGRLLSAKGSTLYVSEPYRFGVYNPVEGYIPFPADITVVAPLKEGVFVVADKVYWLAGSDIRKVEPTVKSNGTAIFGTQFVLTENVTVGWLGEFGLTLGAADGSVTFPSRDVFAPPTATEGYALVVRDDGDVRVVFSLDDTAAYTQRCSREFRQRIDDFVPGVNGLSFTISERVGVTRYGNFKTYGLAEQGGLYYLIDGDSFCQVNGAQDKGSNIPVAISFGKLDGGSPARKRVVAVYADMDCASSVTLTIESESGRYEYSNAYEGSGYRKHRFTPGKGLRETWFDCTLRFENGQGMILGGFDVEFFESARKIR